MNDEQILALYMARDQQAVVETDAAYGSYCHKIAMQILGCTEDAEEMVNDTWLRTWDSIPPNRPTVLKLYLAKITRNLAFSRYRTNTAKKRSGGELEVALEELGECVSSSTGNIDDQLNNAELTAAIQDCLASLPKQQQNIFIRRYFFVEAIPEIAHRYSMKEANVHMTLSRVRKKLKAYLKKEGYDL